jgi:hypothetical protein
MAVFFIEFFASVLRIVPSPICLSRKQRQIPRLPPYLFFIRKHTGQQKFKLLTIIFCNMLPLILIKQSLYTIGFPRTTMFRGHRNELPNQ